MKKVRRRGYFGWFLAGVLLILLLALLLSDDRSGEPKKTESTGTESTRTETKSTGTETAVSAAVSLDPSLEEYGPDDYILPGSSSTILKYSDIKDFTEAEVSMAEKEILARYGVEFTDEAAKAYFGGKNWYTPEISEDSFDRGELSGTERMNLTFLKKHEGA